MTRSILKFTVERQYTEGILDSIFIFIFFFCLTTVLKLFLLLLLFITARGQFVWEQGGDSFSYEQSVLGSIAALSQLVILSQSVSWYNCQSWVVLLVRWDICQSLAFGSTATLSQFGCISQTSLLPAHSVSWDMCLTWVVMPGCLFLRGCVGIACRKSIYLKGNFGKSYT